MVRNLTLYTLFKFYLCSKIGNYEVATVSDTGEKIFLTNPQSILLRTRQWTNDAVHPNDYGKRRGVLRGPIGSHRAHLCDPMLVW